jgi:hypothetical protein
MARRIWLAGVALVVSGTCGCGLFCDRYCEREQRRCEQYNRCCAPAAPAPACAPACPPAYPPQQCCPNY